MVAKKKLRSACAKTKLCTVLLNGGCPKGDKCKFAHSEAELVEPPDLRCTKMCPKMVNKGVCQDPMCTFAHDASKLRELPKPGNTQEWKELLGGDTEQSGPAHGRDLQDVANQLMYFLVPRAQPPKEWSGEPAGFPQGIVGEGKPGQSFSRCRLSTATQSTAVPCDGSRRTSMLTCEELMEDDISDVLAAGNQVALHHRVSNPTTSHRGKPLEMVLEAPRAGAPSCEPATLVNAHLLPLQKLQHQNWIDITETNSDGSDDTGESSPMKLGVQNTFITIKEETLTVSKSQSEPACVGLAAGLLVQWETAGHHFSDALGGFGKREGRRYYHRSDQWDE